MFYPEQVPEKNPGFDVQEGDHHEHGIENADPGKILERPEVGDAFCFFFVEDPNRYGVNGYTFPGGAHDHFNFKLEPAGEKSNFLQSAERIEAIAALRVVHCITRLQAEPEI